MKTFTIDYDYKADVIIGFTEERYSEEEWEIRLNEINKFYGSEGSARARKREAGSLLFAVLKSIAQRVLFVEMNTGYSREGIIEQFNSEEGMPRLDGRDGFTLISICEFRFETSDMEVSLDT